MYLYLDTSKTYWRIPDTDFVLTKDSPVVEITDEDRKQLTQEQLKVLNTAIEYGFVSEVSEEDSKKLSSSLWEKMQGLSVSDIHKRFVGPLIRAKNYSDLKKLLDTEKASQKSRANLVLLFENAIKQVQTMLSPEDLFYMNVEEIKDEDELLSDKLVEGA